METKGVSAFAFETKAQAVQFATQSSMVALESPTGEWIVATHKNAAKLVAQAYKVVHRG